MAIPIYRRICDSITDGALPADFSLPDEGSDDSSLSFIPGAYDGICMYHLQPEELDADGARQMAQALRCASDGDYAAAHALFAEWTKTHRAVSFATRLQRYVLSHTDVLDADRVYHTAFSMAVSSDQPECVKVGLILLILFLSPDETVKEVVRRLGLYDEFTVFAVYNMLEWPDGNEEIFALAQKVHGWGRIHAVDSLQPETDLIRRWLLLEGAHNDVMPAYSALTCWQRSGAEEILAGSPSQEEFSAISFLIGALIDEGPVQGISALENAPQILERFLSLSTDYHLTSEDLEVILAVQRMMDQDSEVPLL